MQYTQFAFTDESTRRRITNTATPKPRKIEKEWAKLDLAPMIMRGKVNLQEAALIVMKVQPELTMSGSLLTTTALAPFGSEESKINQGEEEDKSAGRLVIPKFPNGTGNEEQGPSSSSDQAGKDDVRPSTGGMSSLDFDFLEDFEVERGMLKGTVEPAEDEIPHWNLRQPLGIQTEK